MTLDNYLADKKLTLEAFASLVSEATGEHVAPSRVWKWRRGTMPRAHIVLLIEDLTAGQVTARDFVAAAAALEAAA